jgi:hypothetical protein
MTSAFRVHTSPFLSSFDLTIAVALCSAHDSNRSFLFLHVCAFICERHNLDRLEVTLGESSEALVLQDGPLLHRDCHVDHGSQEQMNRSLGIPAKQPIVLVSPHDLRSHTMTRPRYIQILRFVPDI